MRIFQGLSFDTNYGITDNLTSVILIGGKIYSCYELLNYYYSNNYLHSYFYFNFRVELRRKTPRGKIHHRIIRWLYK